MYILREIEEKDLITINKWRNIPELISMLGAPFRYINFSVDKKWLDNYMDNRNTQVRCAIVSEESDIILGIVSLTNIDQLNQSAEFHIMIGNEENQGKGMGTFAVKKMVEHAFNNLNLHRIELKVLERNNIAKHVYEKCGFNKEGTMKECVYKNGQFENMDIYAILK